MKKRSVFKGGHCGPCHATVAPLSREEAEEYLRHLPDWKFAYGGKVIHADYLVDNFRDGVLFIEKIANLAEEEGHHPDLHLTGYRHVEVDLTTRAIGGLFINDFVLAEKISELQE